MRRGPSIGHPNEDETSVPEGDGEGSARMPGRSILNDRRELARKFIVANSRDDNRVTVHNPSLSFPPTSCLDTEIYTWNKNPSLALRQTRECRQEASVVYDSDMLPEVIEKRIVTLIKVNESVQKNKCRIQFELCTLYNSLLAHSINSRHVHSRNETRQQYYHVIKHVAGRAQMASWQP